MKRHAITASVLLAGLALVPMAWANRTRVVVHPPEISSAAGLQFEAPVRGELVCVFPDADGSCIGAVIFRLLEEKRDEPASPPRRSSPESMRPASGD